MLDPTGITPIRFGDTITLLQCGVDSAAMREIRMMKFALNDFLGECVVRDPESDGLSLAELYGLYVSWRAVKNTAPVPQGHFMTAVREAGIRPAGRGPCRGLMMTDPAARDYIVHRELPLFDVSPAGAGGPAGMCIPWLARDQLRTVSYVALDRPKPVAMSTRILRGKGTADSPAALVAGCPDEFRRPAVPVSSIAAPTSPADRGGVSVVETWLKESAAAPADREPGDSVLLRRVPAGQDDRPAWFRLSAARSGRRGRG